MATNGVTVSGHFSICAVVPAAIADAAIGVAYGPHLDLGTCRFSIWCARLPAPDREMSSVSFAPHCSDS